ncbi:MAG: hypothetical protein V4638_07780 [Bacteroidota bacterium]
MASKRDIKKDLNYMVFDIWDECFFLMDINPDKTGAAEQLIEDAADFQDSMLEKINTAKNKVDFRVIRDSIEKGAEEFVKKLNALA